MSNPAMVHGLEPWYLVSGIERQNRLYTFGKPKSIQLGQAIGLGSTDVPAQFPRPIVEGVQFAEVSAGSSHCAARTLTGAVYVWGSDEFGQLGVGLRSPLEASPSRAAPDPSDDDPSSPAAYTSPADRHALADHVDARALRVRFPVRLAIARAVKKLACGADFTLAALAGPGGGLLAWGRNHWGQCGIPPDGPGPGFHRSAGWHELHVPHVVPAFADMAVEDVSAGQEHAALVTPAGAVYTWGSGRNGRLGQGPASVGPRAFPPGRVAGELAGRPCVTVACGTAHSLALTDDGRVFAWGGAFRGATGQGDFVDRAAPVSVDVPPCRSIAASSVSMAVSREYGQIYVWGDNKMIGVKGRGPATAKPQFLSQFADEFVTEVSCSLAHAVAVTRKGSVLAWGDPSLLPSMDQLSLHRAALKGGAFPGLQMREAVQRAVCGLDCTVLLCGPTRFEMDRRTIEQVQRAICEWYVEQLLERPADAHTRPDANAAMLVAKATAIPDKSAAAKSGPGLEAIAEDEEEDEEDDEGGEDDEMVEGAEGGDAEGRPDEASAESLGEDRRLAVPPLLPLEDLLGLRRSGATMQKMYLRQFLLMCREAKLIDNVTGFQEIISFFTSIAQGKDYNVYEVAGNLAIRYDDLTQLMIKIGRSRFPEAPEDDDALRLLLACHLSQLEHRPHAGLTHLLKGIYQPQVIKALDEFATVETLHQCFAFMTYRKGEPEGLGISVRDAVAALKKQGGASLADLPRLTRFLRQSGVMTNGMMAAVRDIVRKLGIELQIPPSLIAAGIQLADDEERRVKAATEDPTAEVNVDPYDPDATWTSWALVFLMYDPYPGFGCPMDATGAPKGINFAQFTEVVTTCAMLQGQGREEDEAPGPEAEDSGGTESSDAASRASSALNSLDDDDKMSFSGSMQSSYSRYSAATSSAGTVTDIVRTLVAKMQRWRDSQKDAAKGAGGPRSDKDIEDEVDRVFHLYVKLNEQVDEVFIDRAAFLLFCKESKIMDARFNQQHIDRVFDKCAVPFEWTTEYREKLAAKHANDKSKKPFDPVRALPAAKPNERRVLYRQDFSGVIERIASLKITRLRGTKNQVRQLVKQFLLPLSKSKSRFMDGFMGQLLHPDVTELIDRYLPAIMELYQIYSNLDEELGWQTDWDGKDEDEGDTISFLELTRFAKDKELVPDYLSKPELEAIFRKVNYSPGSDDSFLEMSEDEFVDSLGLMAIMGWAKAKDYKNRPAADRIMALFDHLQLKPGEIEQRRPEDDPMFEWKQLTFDPELEALGTLDLPGVLLPEVVPFPAVDWTEDAADFLSRAHNAFRVGDATTSLEMYAEARQRWETQSAGFRRQIEALAVQVAALEEREENDARHRRRGAGAARDEGEDSLPKQKELLAAATARLCEVRMFFLLSMAQVLQVDGQDRAAIELLQAAEEEALSLPEDHPMRATVQGLTGSAFYHVGELKAAYRRFVQAKVQRDTSAQLGPAHHDAAVANNNLACCLERAGQAEKALELFAKALEALTNELGPGHPLTALVARNMSKARRKGAVITRHVFESVRRLEEASSAGVMGEDASSVGRDSLQDLDGFEDALQSPTSGSEWDMPPPPDLMSIAEEPEVPERVVKHTNEALLSRIAALERPPATKGAAKRFVPAAAPKVSAAFLEVLKRPSSHTAYEAAVELLQGGKPPPRNARRRILPSWKPRLYKQALWSLDAGHVYDRLKEDVLRYARGEALRGPSLGAVLQQMGLEALYIETEAREKQLIEEEMIRRGVHKKKKKKKAALAPPSLEGGAPADSAGGVNAPVSVLAISQGMLQQKNASSRPPSMRQLPSKGSAAELSVQGPGAEGSRAGSAEGGEVARSGRPSWVPSAAPSMRNGNGAGGTLSSSASARSSALE